MISLANLVLISGLFALASYSFDQSFRDYINDNKAIELERLTEKLAEKVEVEGWGWLKGPRTRYWQELLEEYHSTNLFNNPSFGPSPRNTTDNRFPSSFRKPPPRGNGPRDSGPRDSGPRHRKSLGPPRGGEPELFFVRNDNLELLLGPEHLMENVRWLPIERNEQIFGYLGFRETVKITDELDRVFAQRIQDSFVWSVFLLVVIAGAFSLILDRWLLKPLVKLRATTQQIRAGDLGLQIELDRKDELGELATDLNRLSNTLEKNRRAQQEWVADISHELRTPVAILKGELEAIEDGIRLFDKESLESLIQEVVRLSLLIDDLHQLTMADAGEFNLIVEPFPFAELLNQLVDKNQGRLEQHNATLRITELPDDIIVKGDEQRLNQLFNNLLGNSLAYTNSPCQIVVDISVDDHWLIINWQDSAPSVEPKKLKYLFERLYRCESSRNRTSGGSGLGLSICKSLVELHHGSISASQSDLGGLAIKVVLPLAR